MVVSMVNSFGSLSGGDESRLAGLRVGDVATIHVLVPGIVVAPTSPWSWTPPYPAAMESPKKLYGHQIRGINKYKLYYILYIYIYNIICVCVKIKTFEF